MVDRPDPLGSAGRLSAPFGGGDSPGRLDARARMTMALLYRRLLEMGIWRHIHSVGGGLLHRGRISVREITDGPALHVSLADNNRIYVHVDRISPAVHATEDGTCRYDRHRSLSHMRQAGHPAMGAPAGRRGPLDGRISSERALPQPGRPELSLRSRAGAPTQGRAPPLRFAC
jgi:hypothetical protein